MDEFSDDPSTFVPLTGIIRDPTLQAREKVAEATIKRYATAMRAGAVFPPVEIAAVEGAMFLVDGWHRFGAAEAAGLSGLRAHVTPVKNHAEAMKLAAVANLVHGKQLSLKERRKALIMVIDAGGHFEGRKLRSLRQLGVQFGTDHNTIKKWIAQDRPKVAKLFEGAGRAGAGDWKDDDGVPKDAQRRLADASIETIATTRTTSRAVRDPHQRGRIIAALEAALKEMKAIPGWIVVDPASEDEDDF